MCNFLRQLGIHYFIFFCARVGEFATTGDPSQKITTGDPKVKIPTEDPNTKLKKLAFIM